jgi:hypothetical protein
MKERTRLARQLEFPLFLCEPTIARSLTLDFIGVNYWLIDKKPFPGGETKSQVGWGKVLSQTQTPFSRSRK